MNSRNITRISVQDDKEEKGKGGALTRLLAFSIFAITIGSSFQLGYSIGSINAPTEIIIDWIKNVRNVTTSEAKVEWSLHVAAFAIGGMIGSLLSSILANSIGRRGTVFLSNLPLVVGALSMFFARDAEWPLLLGVGRLLVGIHAGLSSGVCPMFLSELSPLSLRGTISSLFQLTLTMGMLVSQIVGLPQFLGTVHSWQYILGILPLLFSALQILLLPFCPESPKYTFLVKKEESRGQWDLMKLRKNEKIVETEIAEMRDESGQSSSSLSVSALFHSPLLWPICIALFLMIAQQWSGINAAMFFSTEIFKNMGLGKTAAALATVGMGAINVLQTMVSSWLVDHPRSGRRSLLLYGFSGMLLCALAIVFFLNMQVILPFAGYLACIFLCLFVIAFATGPGSIPWFFVSELFDVSTRGSASAIASAVNWTANFVVGATFLPMEELLGSWTFLIFAINLIISIIFVWKFIPETKGKSLERVQEEVRQRAPFEY